MTIQIYKKAFTLIELLLVIGIIAILSSIVIIAINPSLQLRKAEDAKRTAQSREIQSAIQQYIIDNTNVPAGISSTPTNICTYGVSKPECVNLDVLVDDNYITTLDRDVLETDTDVTGYTIHQDATGFFTVSNHHAGTSVASTDTSTEVDTPLFPMTIVQESPAGTFSNIAGYIGMDTSSNLIVVNTFNESADFTRGVGAATASNGGSDIFFSKYNQAGALQNVVTIGSTGTETVALVNFDTNGNFAVVGRFENTVDFDPSPAVNALTADGDGDTYLAVYNSNFDLQWVVQYSTTSTFPTFNDVLLTYNSNVYLSIRMGGTYDFNPSIGTESLSSSGYDDAFLSRFDATGTYQWTAKFSGAGTDGEMGHLYDNKDGSITLATSQKGAIDIDPSAGSHVVASHGQADDFYTVINADKSWGGLGGSIGGSAYDYTNSFSRDSEGNFMISGLMQSTNFDVDPREGQTQILTKPSTGWDLYAAKFSTAGTVVWSYAWGATGDQFNWNISNSIEDYLIMRGTYTDAFSVDFDPTNIVPLTNAGANDAFLTIIDKNGKHVRTLNISSTSGSDNILGFKKDGTTLWIYGIAGEDADMTNLGLTGTFKGGFIAPIYNVFP